MAPIDAYKQAVADQLQRYRVELLSKMASGFGLALVFRTWQIMDEQLKTPGSVLVYEKLGPEPKFGLRGPARWTIEMQNRAAVELDPSITADPDGSKWVQKQSDYVDFAFKLVNDQGVRTHYTEDKAHGVGYLIRENPEFPKIMGIIAKELTAWAQSQVVDKAFLAMSVQDGYAKFLDQRKDVVALLRMAQLLPLDVEHTAVDIPTEVEVAEFAIAMIPYVGSIVASYEAYTGQNLFGYHLTDVERAVLAATVLLPMVGRLAKGGRALYTESRLVKLYGRDAAGWSKVVGSGAKIAEDGTKLAAVQKAEEAIEKSQQLDKALADEVAKALDIVKSPGGGGVSKAVNQKVLDALTGLTTRSSVYASLDEFAIERILLKGPNLNHLKGQLLEELLESRIVPWLKQRWGGLALALDVPAGKELEFIPGHIIRDLDNAQITDGILGFRDKKTFNILAVFECKAGPDGARELSFAKLETTEGEKLELRAAARDELADLIAESKLKGKPVTKTLEQLEQTYANSQRGGQVRRDIERLSEQGGLLTGGLATDIKFSPTKTKFFGIVPAGLKPSLMARIRGQLAAEKVTFEMFAAELTTDELDGAAAQLQSLAKDFVASPLPPPGTPPGPP